MIVGALAAAFAPATGFVADPLPGGNGRYPTGGFVHLPGATLPDWNEPQRQGYGWEWAGNNDGPATADGTIQFKYHWSSTAAGGPPPFALLAVHTQAAQHGGHHADDGLGDPEVAIAKGVPFPGSFGFWSNVHGPGTLSQGLHWVVVPIVNGAIEYDIAPTADGAPDDAGPAQVAVQVWIDVYDVDFTIAGTVKDATGGLECLVGQNQVAAITNGFISNIAWSVTTPGMSASGMPGSGTFGRVLTDGPAQTNPNVPPQNDGSPSTYVNDHEYDPALRTTTKGDGSGGTASFYAYVPGTETVTGEGDFTFQDLDGTTKTVHLTYSLPIAVVPISFDFKQTFPNGHDSTVQPDPYGSAFPRLVSPGIVFDCDATVPTDFVAGTDAGRVALLQLVEDDRRRSPDASAEAHTGTTDGTGYWLDNAFPSPQSIFAAKIAGDPSSGTNRAGDLPSELLDDPDWTHVAINNAYLTTCVFRPPGANSEYVPLLTLGWTWNAVANAVVATSDDPSSGGASLGKAWGGSGPMAEDPNVHFGYDLVSATWLHAILNGGTYAKP